MYLGTLESDFARSIGILVACVTILFALQGIFFPQVSFYGQVIIIGLDLIRMMQQVGLVIGALTLVGIYTKRRPIQRAAFAVTSWFYMTFAFVLIWLVGLQAPSVIFSLAMVMISGAVYGYLTQKGKSNENINRRSYRKSTLREGLPGSYPSTRFDQGRSEGDNIRP